MNPRHVLALVGTVLLIIGLIAAAYAIGNWAELALGLEEVH